MTTPISYYEDQHMQFCQDHPRHQPILPILRRRVSRGAEWYDANVPGWASRIDASDIVVYSPQNGIDSQLGVFPPDLVKFGCKPLTGGDPILETPYTERDWLGIFWKEEMLKRV